jgi:hypothetical protein
MVLARLEDVRDSIVRGTEILDREIERLLVRSDELEDLLQESAIAISGMEKEYRGEWECRTLDKLARKLEQEGAAALEKDREKERGPSSDPIISNQSRRRKPIPRRQTRPSIKAIPDFTFSAPSGSSGVPPAAVPLATSSHEAEAALPDLIGSLSMDDFEQAVEEIMAM